ncbi:MAG: SpoIIE family protein phosphatase [Ignavibacteria bacterium]|nr:SpoIIE family protein phosphatase [Ignavibacteria bacterium]
MYKSILNFLHNYRQIIISIITIIILIVGVFNIYTAYSINKISNDECLWIPHKIDKDSVIIVFDKVKVGGVTYNAGIRNGDKFRELNGNSLIGTSHAQLLLNKIAEGDYAIYKIENDDGIFETNVLIKKMFNIGDFAFSLLGVIWLIVSFSSLTANPDGKAQRMFYLLGVIFVINKINLLFPQFYSLEYLNSRYFPFVLIWGIASFFLPMVFLHFFLIFPTRSTVMNKRWFKVTLYLAPMVIYVVYYMYIFNSPLYVKNLSSNPAALFVPVNIFFVTSLMISLLMLALNYRKLTKNSPQKKSVFIILNSFVIGILGVIYVIFFAPLVADIVFNTPEHYTPIILIVLIPIAFGYSILKYQLLDVSVVVKNTIVYGSATFTLAILYFLSVYVIGQSIGSVVGTDYQNFISAISFLLFALVFQSTKDKFQGLLTRKFYPEQFVYEKILLQLSKDLNGSIAFTLDHILDTITSTFSDLLKVQKFGLILKNHKLNTFSLVRSRNIIDKSKLVFNEDSQISTLILEKFKEGKFNIIDSQESQNDFSIYSELFQKEEIYTTLPLIVNNNIIGLMIFGLKYSGSKFSIKELELLSAVANQAAVSIENARLYKSETEKLRLERDLELARKIQETLVPKEIPNVEQLEIAGKMLPAMQVGGDYFDVIKISEKRILVVVGDVSGKGLSASLYMTKLQTLINLYSTQFDSPKEILLELNRQIYKAIERHWFITLTLAIFDLDNNIVSVCRAGHVPLLVSQSGNINLFQSKGIGLGLDKGPIFESTLEEEEIKLHKGEVYLFYSDGITETINADEEFFGTENLMNTLRLNNIKSAHEIMNHIIAATVSFRDGMEQFDDITCVVVKVK